MMQASDWIRSVALALRKGGWAVLCCTAVAALSVTAPSAQAAQIKRPVKTARVGKVSAKPAKTAGRSSARAVPIRQKEKGKSVAKGKSRTVAQSAKISKSSRIAAKSHRTGRSKLTQALRRVVAELPAHRSMPVVAVAHQEAVPPNLAIGDQMGAHAMADPLQLQSNAALVLDQDTNRVLLNKNDQAVQPIASLTKLMTGLIISEAKLPMDQPITIMPEDVDTEKHSRSRLAVGTTLTRGEMLHLALMSSENRAAHALARTYPGGLEHFVALMNMHAAALGMKDTYYVEPTGLSSANRSSASDLAKLVATAAQDPLLRQLTTSPGYEVAVGRRVLQYNNTNRLVKNPQWDIGLQKTGFINEAGDCLVMQTRIAGHQFIMVLLDSANKFSRIADAERVRHWVEAQAESGVIRVGASASRSSIPG
jgi:D-alanyl-D-alanine endopeptidase (penicillin-binding protein 7)